MPAVPQTPPTPPVLAKEFRIIRLLGEGAMGKTFVARNLLSGELVAIKTLKLAQSENLKSFELFKREAEVMSSIQVQGVPRFYKSIVSDNMGGECYIVQEYIEAPSLQSYLDMGRTFSEGETIFMLKQLAMILYSLHTAYVPPIIHRDIKPSNILCKLEEIEAQDGQVYLIDFGAVANPQHKSGGSTVAGTYGYMAPEQMLGECTTISDLYAVGATALHMLTGISPVNMESDVFRLKFEDALDQYAPNTSESMRALLGKLLEPKPELRLQSADKLMDDLSHFGELHLQKEITEAEKQHQNRLLRLWRDAQASLDAIKNYAAKPSWKTVPGTLRVLNMNLKLCFEYTFKIQTVSGTLLYTGMYPVANLPTRFQSITNADLPLPCTIAFNPANPRYNYIDAIDENALAQKQEARAKAATISQKKQHFDDSVRNITF